jgi:transposase
MSKALSLDLRVRVLNAIEGGMSCRGAAERFGVSASSAIRWRSRERSEGDARPKALGGDRRSFRMEAHAPLILALIDETPDMTLQELKAALFDRGIAVGYGTLWRFFIIRGAGSRAKKDGARQRTGSARHLKTARSLVRGPARSRP